MPAYISHAIMMEKLYKDNMNNQKIFKNEMNIDDLKTYSLGTDLASTSITLKHNPHTENTRDFFLSMIKYIKDNNLVDKENTIALLYGHIAHYFFDVYAHPFIYYIENSNKKYSLIPTHHLIEAYLDSYLSEKILKKDIMMINETYFNKGHISKESEILLNELYQKVYHARFVNIAYHKTLRLFSLIEKVLKKGLFTKKDLYKISGLYTFLINNDLSISDLSNEKLLTYQNPVSGKYYHKSFMEMFYQSIYKTLGAISEVNEYLYGNKDLDDLKNVFTNLSYDTGIPCEYGHKMIYIKKK